LFNDVARIVFILLVALPGGRARMGATRAFNCIPLYAPEGTQRAGTRKFIGNEVIRNWSISAWPSIGPVGCDFRACETVKVLSKLI